MKKLIFTLILGVVLLTAPVEIKAFTNEDANAYYRGIKDLGNIQKVCDLNGYRSYLVDFDIASLYGLPYGTAYGMTHFDYKTVMIGSYQSSLYIEYTTIHEYAHALSRIGNLHINGVEDILFTEMPNLLWYQMTFNPMNERARYCATNKDEYFAEAFAMYYFHPEALKTYCPVTYDYIKSVIKLLR